MKTLYGVVGKEGSASRISPSAARGRLSRRALYFWEEVKKSPGRDFGNPEISDCNLTVWKQGGYGEWEFKETGLEEARNCVRFCGRAAYNIKKMMDDRQLLASYAKEGSEEAFAELARRHTALVYSAAVRQVRDPQLAEDVTQTVFVNLARRARSIPESSILAGWLHINTRYAALDLLRRELRRRRREQQAAEMNAPTPEHSPGWKEIRPLLDEALTQLPAADRDALLLRFFEQKDFAGVGAALGASAEAARKRVDRALERLREHLGKRGITTTATALAGAMTAHAVEMAPAGLAASVATGSIAAAGAAGGWVSNLFVMTNTKIALGAALVAGMLAVPLVLQQRVLGAAESDQARLQARLAQQQAQAAVPIIDTTNKAARDRADLERLRAEAEFLRSRSSEFSAQAKALWEERAARAHRDGATLIHRFFGLKDARDAGTTTPADTMQTFIAAMMKGDTNRIAELLAVEPQAGGDSSQAVLEKVLKELAQESDHMRNDSQSDQLSQLGFYILEQQPGTNNDQWVVVSTSQLDANGSVRVSRLDFRDGPGGWQWIVGTNGKPVEQTVSN